MNLIKQTKYLKFWLIKEKEKTNVYWITNIKNDHSKIAEIRWYSGWRQYVFQPEGWTEWNDSCLMEIYEFLQWLREEHKQKRARNSKT